jgi:hypothetical protein
MAHLSIEYMIFIPVLIAQIFLFPLTATIIMQNYENSRQVLELQQTAGNLGSSIQQLYYTMNHDTVSDGTMQIILHVPTLIDSRPYTTTFSHAIDAETSYAIMNVTLKLIGTTSQTSTLVTLGPNVDWQENLSFNSTANSLSVVANKTSNSIWLSFGGAN